MTDRTCPRCGAPAVGAVCAECRAVVNVVALSSRRPPVVYTVDIVHHWDGRLEIFVRDIADDTRSRESVADALERAAASIRNAAATQPIKK